jgi:hypothetical protein
MTPPLTHQLKQTTPRVFVVFVCAEVVGELKDT